MYDPDLRRESVKVLPGDYFATRGDVAIVTVLGSCVAACLRDRREGIGGMNHFMLPRDRNERDPASARARYGVHAMELLINELLRLGASRANLEAKVFGGGNVLPGVTALNVGGANAQFVSEFLRDESIPIVASDLGGEVSRKICFFPASGRVLLRGIGNGHLHTVLEGETRYVERLHETPGSAGSMELFT
jgi:chemotaxis protein CheD